MPDFLCHATYETRVWNSDATRRDHVTYKGSPEAISEQVAESVGRHLKEGRTTQIVLTPVALWNIVDLDNATKT